MFHCKLPTGQVSHISPLFFIGNKFRIDCKDTLLRAPQEVKPQDLCSPKSQDSLEACDIYNFDKWCPVLVYVCVSSV